MSKSTEVAITSFINSAEVPAHLIANAQGLGSENVNAGDLLLSQLSLIQDLSPQKRKGDPAYIPGADVGLMFDSVTGDLYEKCFLVNLFFHKQFTLFGVRGKPTAGQFEGTYNSVAEAKQAIADKELDAKMWNITETDVHTCLLLDEQGQAKKPVILYMSGSKLKISKAWNSSIALQQQSDFKKAGAVPDRFAYVWVCESVMEKSGTNAYQNYKLTYAGTISDPALYEEAKSNYLSIKGLHTQ